MTPPEMHYRLRDGTRVLVRPIRPHDKNRVREGFARLSPSSRHYRFLEQISELSTRQLQYFTEIDYTNHMAWVAVDPAQPGEPGLGVARYIRLENDPTVAEVAVTVLDSHQGRGLGTLLLALLSRSAREHGIETFRAYVLEDNTAMMRIFCDLGATVSRNDAGELQVDVPVPADPRSMPDTPTGRVFKAVAGRAGGALPPAISPPEAATRRRYRR